MLNISKNKTKQSKSHRYSEKQEKKFAKDYISTLQPNSGRGSKKGDSILPINNIKFMIDNKATIYKSYTITHEILNKLIEDALQQNTFPILHVETMCDTINKSEFFVLPKITFDEILEHIRQTDRC